MPTECSSGQVAFGTVEGRSVVATFDGGAVTSDAGALLLGATDRAIRLVERFAAFCFVDRMQVVLGLAVDRLGQEVQHVGRFVMTWTALDLTVPGDRKRIAGSAWEEVHGQTGRHRSRH